jgi:hypothetical protein
VGMEHPENTVRKWKIWSNPRSLASQNVSSQTLRNVEGPVHMGLYIRGRVYF